VGLVAGFILVLIYGATKGKNTYYKKFNLKKASLIILGIFFAISVLFITTRHSTVWSSIPGVNRVAEIGGQDATTQTRLIAFGVGARAMNPINNGLKKLIIGWGPDNYSLAYGQYFNPAQFKYEMRWFDRSHNKLMDVFVMTGLLGLLAYLSIYFFLFRAVFKNKEVSVLNAGLVFFTASLLGHLLFVFDQITTSIPFFATIAFVVVLVYLPEDNKNQHTKDVLLHNSKKHDLLLESFFVIFSIFLTFIFFRNDVVACIQMKKYVNDMNNPDKTVMLRDINSIFVPITSSRANILKSFLSETASNVSSDTSLKLSEDAIAMAEDYIKHAPFDIKSYIDIATAYTKKGEALKDQGLMDKGEMYFRKMLIYSPNRPDSNFGLALNLFYQKKYDESFIYSERAFDLSPEYFIDQSKTANGLYSVFFQYFYQKRDKDNFLKVAKRLVDSKYINPEIYNQMQISIQKYNVWPPINFRNSQ
jgi:tetratricopeptide (TPR) repeat protein